MKILIADDHLIFRNGLREIVKSQVKDCLVVEAENGIEAYKLAEENTPNIAILDIDMPELNGLEVCKRIIDNQLPIKVIILTMYKNEEMFNSAMENGAMGYVLKDNSASDLNECINRVIAGKSFISPKISDYMDHYDNYKNKKGEIKEGLSKLTNAELKTLKLVSDNFTSREIAEMLFVTQKTVENYRSRICKKLELDSRNNSLLKWVLDNKSILDSFDEF